MSAGKLITVLKPDRKEILRGIGICFGIAILSIISYIFYSFWVKKISTISQIFPFPKDNFVQIFVSVMLMFIFLIVIIVGMILLGQLVSTFWGGLYEICIYEDGFEYQDYGFYTWTEIEFDLKIPPRPIGSKASYIFPFCCFVRRSEKPVFFDSIPYEGIIYDSNSVNTHMEALRDYLNEQKANIKTHRKNLSDIK